MEILIQGLNHIYMPDTPFEKQALRDIDLQIDSHSFVAILGPTGSGKSTLIQTLSGLLRPTSGKIHIGPYVIDKESKDLFQVRRHVGVVFQYPEHQLFEETVAKDIAFGPHNQGLSESEIEERVSQAMKWVGLSPELASRSPFQLSGGQMRRVAIAGILAMQPDILILDEPTAGLDPQGQKDLLDTIYRLHKERQFTVILVTHHMDDAARYADHLYLMSEGQCVLNGTAKQVFSQPDRLRQLQLDLPEITKLIMQLNQRLSPPLSTDMFALEDLVSALLARREREEIK
ncbi:energy-coupling factor transporter ATPase [Hazenella coriacea]|uniref:Energy-coupling factor transporter ATP-binding protein EcfA2 n=1 Tax=Hazenella coriacea TaxID=1179467 RepID=A0A4R3L9J0_9BACL|nr:energy-coupling factor transporter ATPase [Hazenella coriacea]TCS94156.1 energy-coupling factor transport system ATP-binding protein [Hazenella coriacea]